MLIHLILLLTSVLPLQSTDPIAEYRQTATERWEEAVQELEQLDASEEIPNDPILFVGSSSIRLWTTCQEDMSPWPVLRRGYGGARFSDLAVFIHRLVDPHDFSALAIFVANDISGSEQDKTPEQVLELCKYIVQEVRKENPDRPIFFIEITPTSSRWDAWSKIERFNRMLEEHCDRTAGLHFIATAEHFLSEVGKPRDELFRDDKLHLNRDGYLLWSKLIKAEIAKVLPAP